MDYITKRDDGSMQIKLSKGYQFDGAKADYLVMREPTVGDNLAADSMGGSNAEKEVRMLANLCMVTPDQIKGLAIRDYRRLAEAFANFID